MAMIQIFLSIVALIVTILIALGEKRLLAAFLGIVGSLIAPNALITWIALDYSASLTAPTTSDVSSFVIKVALTVGTISSIYPSIWGILFFPKLREWILKFPPSTREAPKSSSNDQGGLTP